MILLGIDPGSVSGAYALLDTAEGKIPVVGDLPVADTMVDGAELARVVEAARPHAGIIEQVSAMPKQGARSGFRFGMGVGIAHGVVLGQRVPLHLVTPKKWKTHFQLGADKEKARALAIRLFPAVTGLHLKKHHGRAEALLLAHYLRTVVLKQTAGTQ